MRILLIGYEHKSVDDFVEGLVNRNHKVKRINILISDEDVHPIKHEGDIDFIDIRNFHDITIEIIEFDPQNIIYLPIVYDDIPMDFSSDVLEIIYSEFIEHLIETASMISCKVNFITNPISNNISGLAEDGKIIETNRSEYIEQGQKIMRTYPKSLIISSNLSNIELESLIDKILKDS
jgi:hypothetical protein